MRTAIRTSVTASTAAGEILQSLEISSWVAMILPRRRRYGCRGLCHAVERKMHETPPRVIVSRQRIDNSGRRPASAKFGEEILPFMVLDQDKTSPPGGVIGRGVTGLETRVRSQQKYEARLDVA